MKAGAGHSLSTTPPLPRPPIRKAGRSSSLLSGDNGCLTAIVIVFIALAITIVVGVGLGLWLRAFLGW